MTTSADARPSPVRHDLTSRPACHRKHESTGARLSTGFAALAVTSFGMGNRVWLMSNGIGTTLKL